MAQTGYYYEVRIQPIDPLLFGDNRSARAGLDHVRLDQDVSPHAIHGAIGQFVAGGASVWPEHRLGPRVDDIFEADPQSVASLLGFAHDHQGRLWFHCPRHLRLRRLAWSGAFQPVGLLAPQSLSGAAGEAPERELLLTGTSDDEQDHEGPVLVDLPLLGEILGGRFPPSIAEQTVTPGEIYDRELRPGLAVDPVRGVAAEGMLFTRPYRRFDSPRADEASDALASGFRAWLKTPGVLAEETSTGASLQGTGFLGGDRGRVRLEIAGLGACPLPSLRSSIERAVSEEESDGFLVYLLTPRIGTEAGPVIDGFAPVAAAVGKPRYTSGWNSQLSAPRPLRALAPAGSVYFYRWPGGASTTGRADLMRRLWLAAPDAEGAAAGFGRVLPGVWPCS